MTGEEHFLDRLTSIDDILRNILSILTDILDVLPEIQEEISPPGEFPIRHLPYVAEGTLGANETVELLIRTDNEQGLGVPGRTGYIRNDGAGSLTFKIYDGISGSSLPQTLNNGEYINFLREDNIYFDRVILSSTAGCSYRAAFTR